MLVATSMPPKVKVSVSGKSKPEWKERRSSSISVKIVYYS